MVQVEEMIGHETRKKLLVEMIRNIAKELDSQYKGDIKLQRYMAWGGPMSFGGTSYASLRIEEQEKERYLAIFPITKRKSILSVDLGDRAFSSVEGGVNNTLKIYLADEKAEPVLQKYLNKYTSKLKITKVYIQRIQPSHDKQLFKIFYI